MRPSNALFFKEKPVKFDYIPDRGYEKIMPENLSDLSSEFERAAAYLADARVGLMLHEKTAQNHDFSIQIDNRLDEGEFPLPLREGEASFFIQDYRYSIEAVFAKELREPDNRPVIKILLACYAWIEKALNDSSSFSEAQEKFLKRLEPVRSYQNDEAPRLFLKDTGLESLIPSDSQDSRQPRQKALDHFGTLVASLFVRIGYEVFNEAGDYDPVSRISQNPRIRRSLGLN